MINCLRNRLRKKTALKMNKNEKKKLVKQQQLKDRTAMVRAEHRIGGRWVFLFPLRFYLIFSISISQFSVNPTPCMSCSKFQSLYFICLGIWLLLIYLNISISLYPPLYLCIHLFLACEDELCKPFNEDYPIFITHYSSYLL